MAALGSRGRRRKSRSYDKAPLAIAGGGGEVIAGFPLVFGEVYEWPLFRVGVVASTRYKVGDSGILVLGTARTSHQDPASAPMIRGIRSVRVSISPV